MRAFTLRFLAPLVMSAATFAAVAPAYTAVTAVTAGTSHLADGCPPTSHWDNVLNECVPN